MSQQHPPPPAVKVGTLVRDTRTNRVGVVMDRTGTKYQLRPEKGGKEWDARPEDLEPAQAIDRLLPAVKEANRRSRERLR